MDRNNIQSLDQLNKGRYENDQTVVIKNPNYVDALGTSSNQSINKSERKIINPADIIPEKPPKENIPAGARSTEEARALNAFDASIERKKQEIREDMARLQAESEMYEEMAEMGTLDEEIENVTMPYDNDTSNKDNSNDNILEIKFQNEPYITPAVEEYANKRIRNMEDYFGTNSNQTKEENSQNTEPQHIPQQPQQIQPEYIPQSKPVEQEKPHFATRNIQLPNSDNIKNDEIKMDKEIIHNNISPDLKEVKNDEEPRKIINDVPNMDIPSSIDEIYFDDDDFDDLDDEVDKDSIKQLQSDIANVILPISNKVNITGYKVSKDPISIGSINTNTRSSNKRIAKWPLINTGRIVTMEGFNGPEMQYLDEQLNRARNYGDIVAGKEVYTMLYNHCVDSDKPATMESWLNSIAYSDDDALYACVYAVCFAGANYIPTECPQDKHMFLTHDIPMKDMVIFPDSNTEKIFYDIYNGVYSSPDSWHDVVRIPISESFVADIKFPSLYDYIFRYNNFDREFDKKYKSIASVCMHIDDLYYINHETKELKRINYKKVNNDFKTLKYKIVTYSKVFKMISSDEFALFASYINAVTSRYKNINYCVPELLCPKCGHKIPKVMTNMASALFSRHRLGAIATTLKN